MPTVWGSRTPRGHGRNRQPLAAHALPAPRAPGGSRPQAAAPVRKPPQVLMLKKEEPAAEPDMAAAAPPAGAAEPRRPEAPAAAGAAPVAPAPAAPRVSRSDDELFDLGELEGLTMADLLGPEASRGRSGGSGSARSIGQGRPGSTAAGDRPAAPSRTVDDFDFDEEAFLAALDENEPVGTTGEVVSGVVIGMESDGVYVDIGGKAPGFMPKKECGLGVITNLKERFPRGLQVEVLVTREQNADGMVTVSARALALRQSWEKVRQLEKDNKVVQVKVNGFNRGGVTCDLEGCGASSPAPSSTRGRTTRPWWARPSAWPSWR